MLKYRLDDKSHNEIFLEIKEELLYEKRYENYPVALFTGGQPGAGKTKIKDEALREMNHNAVIIDPDELRGYHPDYDNLMKQDNRNAAARVHGDASAWAFELFEAAVQARCNIIIDGTMRNTEKISRQCQRLREAGYRVEVRIMAVSELHSRLGIVRRYEEKLASNSYGRWVDRKTHDRAYQALPETAEKLEREKRVDRLVVYSRYKLLYDNRLQDGQWQQPEAGRECIEAERSRQWTADERQQFDMNFHEAENWIQQRSAPEDEKQTLIVLRHDYEAKQQDYIWFVALTDRHRPGMQQPFPVCETLQDAVKLKNMLHDSKAVIYKVSTETAIADSNGVKFDLNAIKMESDELTAIREELHRLQEKPEIAINKERENDETEL